MRPVVFDLCVAGLCLAMLLALVRLARGPTVLDRVVALDLVIVCGVGLIGVITLRTGTPHYLELILTYSLVGFLTTVTLTLYLERTLPRRKSGVDTPPHSPP
ncbi:MAG: monovalent cation/H+ antiporter complex subunit F [Limisphaerales bacterium]